MREVGAEQGRWPGLGPAMVSGPRICTEPPPPAVVLSECSSDAGVGGEQVCVSDQLPGHGEAAAPDGTLRHEERVGLRGILRRAPESTPRSHVGTQRCPDRAPSTRDRK